MKTIFYEFNTVSINQAINCMLFCTHKSPLGIKPLHINERNLSEARLKKQKKMTQKVVR